MSILQENHVIECGIMQLKEALYDVSVKLIPSKVFNRNTQTNPSLISPGVVTLVDIRKKEAFKFYFLHLLITSQQDAITIPFNDDIFREKTFFFLDSKERVVQSHLEPLELMYNNPDTDFNLITIGSFPENTTMDLFHERMESVDKECLRHAEKLTYHAMSYNNHILKGDC